MTTFMHPINPDFWVLRHLGGTNLGDKRRDNRLLSVGKELVTGAGMSLPKLFPRKYDCKATYNLFSHAAVTPEAIQATHRALIHEEMRRPDESGRRTTTLLVEDTTDVTYHRTTEIPGLERSGNKASPTQQGFKLHTVLALRIGAAPPAEGRRPAVDVLGLAHQESYTPRARPPAEKARDPHGGGTSRISRARESDLWLRSGQTLGQAPADPSVRLICVADRGADYRAFLQDRQQRGFGYVVRSCYNRALDQVNEDGEQLFAQTHARTQPALGTFNLELRARPARAGRPAEPARDATMSVSAVPVTLSATGRSGARPAHPPLPCWIVRVWEASPPDHVGPLEWLLLTNQEVRSFDEAYETVQFYMSRWVIEEYHKALKTGLKVERLQLEVGKRLKAAVAVMAVVAVRLLALTELARAEPEAPAYRAGLGPMPLIALRMALNFQRLPPLPEEHPTVRDVIIGLARLGGYSKGKNDRGPGWEVLNKGYIELSRFLNTVYAIRTTPGDPLGLGIRAEPPPVRLDELGRAATSSSGEFYERVAIASDHLYLSEYSGIAKAGMIPMEWN